MFKKLLRKAEIMDFFRLACVIPLQTGMAIVARSGTARSLRKYSEIIKLVLQMCFENLWNMCFDIVLPAFCPARRLKTESVLQKNISIHGNLT
jgi:hypothetical protein